MLKLWQPVIKQFIAKSVRNRHINTAKLLPNSTTLISIIHICKDTNIIRSKFILNDNRLKFDKFIWEGVGGTDRQAKSGDWAPEV